MPTLSVYVSEQDEIYEIRVTFDNHGYQDSFYELYRGMCLCTEKMLISGLSETDAEGLFEILWEQADRNFFGTHDGCGDPQRPKPDGIYRCGSIGAYCFYGAGNIEMCFVPLTPDGVERFKDEDIPLNSPVFPEQKAAENEPAEQIPGKIIETTDA